MGSGEPSREIATRTFPAMGTTIDVFIEATDQRMTDDAAAAVTGEFLRLEEIFSRFSPHSELSRLNAGRGDAASPDLLAVVAMALDARVRSGGRFDPTVHDALVAAGYDRTFDEVVARGALPGAAHPRPAGGGVQVDRAAGTVALALGTRLDLGGIAKGYAVDRAVAIAGAAGPCLVNAGGDIAVAGLPEAGMWPVAVETPGGSLTVGLTSGALATSGVDRRRWARGDVEAHHVIDPLTGLPAATDLLRVTVSAPTAVEAEWRATELLVAGADRAAAIAERDDLSTVLVRRDGDTILTGALR